MTHHLSILIQVPQCFTPHLRVLAHLRKPEQSWCTYILKVITVTVKP